MKIFVGPGDRQSNLCTLAKARLVGASGVFSAAFYQRSFWWAVTRGNTRDR